MANDVFQLIIGGNVAGQPVENVLHFTNGGTLTDPINQAVELNDAFEEDVMDAWLDVLPENYAIMGTKAKQVNNGGGPTVAKIQPAFTLGHRVGNADTSAVGPVLLIPYQNGPRWFTGRIFLPGVSQEDIDNNQLDAALITAIGALNTILVAPFAFGAGTNFEYGIYLSDADVFKDADAISISSKPGLQNRRLRPVF